MWSGGRVSFVARRLVAALACVGVAAAFGLYAAAPASAATGPAASLLLDGQSQWVVPPSNGGAATFDLALDARGAPPGATVEATVYPRLYTRDGFKSAVKSGPHGYPLSRTAPVAYSSLPSAPPGEGGVQLALTVVTTGWTDSGTKIGLDCTRPTGSGTCAGVYPVDVELLTSSGRAIAHLTTFLTYAVAKSAHPLDFAWVVPVQAPVHLDTATTKPTRAIGALDPADASAIERLVAQLGAASGVPVTLDASPATLQKLHAAGAAGRASLATLAAMSENQTRAEVLRSPYVPIDLGALAGGGDPTEILHQMAAGATVLRRLGIRTASTSTWVTTDPVGSDLLKGLRTVHATSVVVSGTDLSPTLTPSAGTWASTFQLRLGARAADRTRTGTGTLAGSRTGTGTLAGTRTGTGTLAGTRNGAHAAVRAGAPTTVPAAETDNWLDAQFQAHPGDPALAASQLLADLAMVHFERPNTRHVRGMIAMPPSGWQPNPVFNRVLLDGLIGNPNVVPVTLTTFFKTVTPDGTRNAKTRGSGPVLARGTVAELASARAELTNFVDAIVGNPPAKAQLADLLLATETNGLSRRARDSAIAEFRRVLQAQISQIKIDDQRTFTLTSSTGVIPVTVDSSAPYTVVGTLSVSGNKFVFPHSSSTPTFRLEHATNSWRVDVKARTSGYSPLHVAFTSPNGKLVIAAATLSVTSTATTIVGVALTVLALAILFAWWGRTWWNGRRRTGLASVKDNKDPS